MKGLAAVLEALGTDIGLRSWDVLAFETDVERWLTETPSLGRRSCITSMIVIER